MKKIILFLLFIISMKTTLFCQENKSCVRQWLDFYSCRSHNLCSTDEQESYHKTLIEQYLNVVITFKDSIKGDDYNQIGKEYYFLKMYDSAMFYYKLAHTMNDTSAPIINNIGTVYFVQENYEQSLIYFEKAHSIDSLDQSFMNNIASYYGITGNYNKSIEWNLKSLNVGKKYSDNLLSLQCLATSYQFLHKKSKAKYYSKKYNDYKAGKNLETEEIDCDCIKYKPVCSLN